MKSTLLEIKNNKDLKIQVSEDFNYQSIIKVENNAISSNIDFIIAEPNLNSQINFKCVVKDNSDVSLNIKLIIPRGIRNVNTYLKIDCLVLGEESHVEIVPSLEIEENTVKAGHGATIGYLDTDQLNLLLSRGFNQKESEDLLVEGFLNLN